MKRGAIALVTVVVLGIVTLAVLIGEPRRASNSDLSPPSGQEMITAPRAISAASMNGVINPTLYPGSDLGKKINNVFASGNHCAEVHIPAGKYVYSTTIRMSKACQSLYGSGSAMTTLEYTGNGDAIVWQMQPYTIQKAGTLKGITLKGPGSEGENGIRSGTIVGATFEDLVINNFHGPHSTAILLENIKATVSENTGATMQGWTERTVIRDVHIGIPHFGNTVAVAFMNNGGTNSFGYTDISDVWLGIEKGQIGVQWGRGTYTYNSKLNFHANISALGTNSFVIDGVIRNSLLFLTGEAGCAKDLVHVGVEGEVQSQGFVAVNCVSELTRGQYVRTDLSGVQVDNPKWDAFQLSPIYAPLVNGKGLLLMNNLDHNGETDVTNYYGLRQDPSLGGFSFYNTFASILSPNTDPKALLAKLDPHGNWMTRGSASWGGGPPIVSSDNVAQKTQLPLSGKTGVIGGALKAGICAHGVASVPGAHIGQIVAKPNASDGSLDSPLEIVSGAITAVDTVTVQRCAVAPVTLFGKTYNVRVIP